MSEEKKDIEIIIDDETSLTKSQQDRMFQFELMQQDMFDLISSTIKKVTAKDGVKAQTLEHLERKMVESYEDLSVRDLAKVYEILAKSDDDLSKGLFDIIKGQQKIIIESKSESVNIDNTINTQNLTKEDIKQVKEFMNNMNKAKEVVDLMSNIKETEFNEEEFEDKE